MRAEPHCRPRKPGLSRSPTRRGLREEASENAFKTLAGVTTHPLFGLVDTDHVVCVLLRYVPLPGAKAGDSAAVTPNAPISSDPLAIPRTSRGCSFQGLCLKT